MKIQLEHFISISLRSRSSSFEQGENLRVKVTLDEREWNEEREREIFAWIQSTDHRHLTDDFALDSPKEFLFWLKERLRQLGLKEFTLELSGSRTFCRLH